MPGGVRGVLKTAPAPGGRSIGTTGERSSIRQRRLPARPVLDTLRPPVFALAETIRTEDSHPTMTVHDERPRVRRIDLPEFADARGRLTALDHGALPFEPVRVFFVSDVPAGTVRGGHAHRRSDQLLICLAGRIEIALDAGTGPEVVVCRPGGAGVLVPRGVWAQQTYVEKGSILLVLCSHAFDPEDYIGEPAPR